MEDEEYIRAIERSSYFVKHALNNIYDDEYTDIDENDFEIMGKLIGTAISSLLSCDPDNPEFREQQIQKSIEAISGFSTYDEDEKIVLCWTKFIEGFENTLKGKEKISIDNEITSAWHEDMAGDCI